MGYDLLRGAVVVVMLVGLSAAGTAATQTPTADRLPVQGAADMSAGPGVSSEQAEVQLNAIEPSPVPAGRMSREVFLLGSGFVPGTRAAVSRNGEVMLLGPERLRVIDSQRLAMRLTPGEKQSDWAVQVSTPDDRHSNVLRFKVMPVASDESLGAEPSATSSATVAGEPVSEEGVAWRGHEWLAAQPKTNFALQLMASNNRESLEWMANRYALPEPLARFAMERDGERLYALTAGSFPDRAAAEHAAQQLPEGVGAWVRSMGSIQQVMRAEVAADTTPTEAHGEPPLSTQFEDTAWLWSQDPTHYTLQLAASVNEQAVEALMRRASLPGEMAVVQTLRQGRRWYVLIYGSFASDATARAAISHLPETLQKAKPWPRRFAELHDEMSRANPLP